MTPKKTNKPYPQDRRLDHVPVRPIIYSAGGINYATAICTVTGNEPSATPSEYYGTPVDIAGLPDFNSATLPTIYGSSTPISASSSINKTGVQPGIAWGGSGSVGVVFYVGGQKIDWSYGGSGTYHLDCGSEYHNSRLLPYGYYGGRYNAAMDGSDQVRGDGFNVYTCPPQVFSPPYVPDQIGLWCRLIKSSVDLSLKVFLWWEEPA